MIEGVLITDGSQKSTTLILDKIFSYENSFEKETSGAFFDFSFIFHIFSFISWLLRDYSARPPNNRIPVSFFYCILLF